MGVVDTVTAANTDVPAPIRDGLAAPAVLIRLEAAAIAVAAVYGFHLLEVSWWWFAALVLLPDVGLAGYLVGARTGAWTYNLTHTLVGPFLLGSVGAALGATLLLAVAAVWLAHIGVDRLAGFGLKYATGARHTHLQRLHRR